MQIQFKSNFKKILEAIVYVAENASAKDFHHILKILFYADKIHLQKYGRPVTGDTYIKMSAGPVASMAYDILKLSDFLPPEQIEASSQAIKVERNGVPIVSALRSAEMRFFSGSDIVSIDQAIERCKGISFSDLCNVTHAEKAWLNAQMNGQMDFEDFVDEDIEHRAELIKYIRESSPTLVV